MTLWYEQWKLFAPGFKEGKSHLLLKDYGKDVSLFLLPGPGFGDFSHPTTRLTLKLLSKSVHNRNVIDIGCGSGILSLAAALLGASSVYGYDIDPEAVSHARENNVINQQKVVFGLAPPVHIPPHSLILMNMISSEQERALSTITPFLKPPFHLITSGVLETEIPSYLKWTTLLHFEKTDCITEEGWAAFEFFIP
ncbi:MAG: 50S ribosomal protein L11 methyltransferase [Candidatus Rhabdochlamydia sp.]